MHKHTEYASETVCDLKSLKYLLCGPLQKKFANPVERQWLSTFSNHDPQKYIIIHPNNFIYLSFTIDIKISQNNSPATT